MLRHRKIKQMNFPSGVKDTFLVVVTPIILIFLHFLVVMMLLIFFQNLSANLVTTLYWIFTHFCVVCIFCYFHTSYLSFFLHLSNFGSIFLHAKVRKSRQNGFRKNSVIRHKTDFTTTKQGKFWISSHLSCGDM